MTVRTKMTRAQQEVFDLWTIQLGKTKDDPELVQLLETMSRPRKQVRIEAEETHERKVREAESIILHIRRIEPVKQLNCQNCGEQFATSYWYNKHCSDECLRRTLDKLGLQWNPEKTPEERWQGQPPSTIAPATLRVLKDWAKEILAWDDPPPLDVEPVDPSTLSPMERLKLLKNG